MPPLSAQEQRPLRFRVWDGERMLTPEEAAAEWRLAPDGRVFMRWAEDGPLSEDWGPVGFARVLFSTGLRDSEGVEVYEGDRLALDNYATWEAVWHEGGFAVQNETNPGTYYPLTRASAAMRRVVGHVHEPAEVL